MFSSHLGEVKHESRVQILSGATMLCLSCSAPPIYFVTPVTCPQSHAPHDHCFRSWGPRVSMTRWCLGLPLACTVSWPELEIVATSHDWRFLRGSLKETSVLTTDPSLMDESWHSQDITLAYAGWSIKRNSCTEARVLDEIEAFKILVPKHEYWKNEIPCSSPCWTSDFKTPSKVNTSPQKICDYCDCEENHLWPIYEVCWVHLKCSILGRGRKLMVPNIAQDFPTAEDVETPAQNIEKSKKDHSEEIWMSKTRVAVQREADGPTNISRVIFS